MSHRTAGAPRGSGGGGAGTTGHAAPRPAGTLPHAPSADDPLDDFQRRPLAFEGTTRNVYVAGRGPAVIVLAEMPGISPHVARFARWVREAGFTVYLPSLFGTDGAYPQAEAGLAVLRRACVSAEFRALEANASSPVTTWLRALARLAHGECGGPGAGAVGMCFTGNSALGMMLEPAVLAPVLCQPSLPLNDLGAIQRSPAEASVVRGRLEREDLTVLAYRFEGVSSAPRSASPPTAPRWGRASDPGSCRRRRRTRSRRRSSSGSSAVRTAW